MSPVGLERAFQPCLRDGEFSPIPDIGVGAATEPASPIGAVVDLVAEVEREMAEQPAA